MFKIFLIVGALICGYQLGQRPCVCASLPENYFFIETFEDEMCVDQDRTTFITSTTSMGRAEIK